MDTRALEDALLFITKELRMLFADEGSKVVSLMNRSLFVVPLLNFHASTDEFHNSMLEDKDMFDTLLGITIRFAFENDLEALRAVMRSSLDEIGRTGVFKELDIQFDSTFDLLLLTLRIYGSEIFAEILKNANHKSVR